MLLSACQPLPQPFRPESKGPKANELLRPIGESSVFVAPVSGLDGDLAAAMAEDLAAALAEREIPASAHARSVLSSTLTVSIARAGDGGSWQWRMDRPGGGGRAGEAQPLRQAMARALAGENRERLQLARAMAAVIAPALQPDLPDAHNDPLNSRTMAVQECVGAPGDGNRSLRQAMREILILAEQPLVPDPAEADYLISCNVRVWADGPDSERVTIEWVLQAREGGKLGDVKQTNRIPKGQLASLWGQTAHIIAQGGWQGLSQILEARHRPG